MPVKNLDIRVLLVDDSKTMRRIEKDYLCELGICNVDEADNGKKGLSKLRSNQYDVVFLDWSMPVMSGIELLKTMREDEKLMKMPVIMITAEGLKKNRLQAVKAGANGYITKPFTVKKLEERLVGLRLIKKTSTKE